VYYNLSVSTASIPRPPASRGFFRVAWKALRELFHEVTGAIFGLFGFAAANSAIRSWRMGMSRWVVVLPLVYALMMAFFSITSFLRARRVR
jgi:hypothetical protein